MILNPVFLGKKNYCKSITFGDVLFLESLEVMFLRQIKYITKNAFKVKVVYDEVLWTRIFTCL